MTFSLDTSPYCGPAKTAAIGVSMHGQPTGAWTSGPTAAAITAPTALAFRRAP